MEWGNYSWVPSVVVACCALVATVLIYRRTRRTKTFDFWVTADQKIFLTGMKLPDDVSVFVGSVKLEHPRLISVVFENTGNEPISRADFERPITIKNDIPVHGVAIHESPVSVKVKYKDQAQNGRVTLVPDGINKQEFFRAVYLVDSTDQAIAFDYRITGATRPERDLKKYYTRADNVRLTVIILATMLFFAFTAAVSGFGAGEAPGLVTALMLFLLGALFVASFWKFKADPRFPSASRYLSERRTARESNS